MNNKLLHRFVMILALSGMAIYHVCYSCGPPYGWSVQEISERAASADIVIVGKVIRSAYRAPWKNRTKGSQVGLYDARFMIVCTLKGGPIPEFITVYGFGRVDSHCVNSPALQSKTYIGLLRKEKRKYFVHEVNMQRGTVLFNASLVTRIAEELKLRNPNYCFRNNSRDRPKDLVRTSKEVTNHRSETTNELNLNAEKTAVIQDSQTNVASKEKLGKIAFILLLIYCYLCLLT